MPDKVRISARLPRSLVARIPPGRGQRSKYLVQALRHLFEARDKRAPVPLREELKALRELVSELNRIGVNLNQLVHVLYLVEDGCKRVPTAEDIRKLQREIGDQIDRARRVIGFWRLD